MVSVLRMVAGRLPSQLKRVFICTCVSTTKKTPSTDSAVAQNSENIVRRYRTPAPVCLDAAQYADAVSVAKECMLWGIA